MQPLHGHVLAGRRRRAATGKHPLYTTSTSSAALYAADALARRLLLLTRATAAWGLCPNLAAAKTHLMQPLLRVFTGRAQPPHL